MTAAELSIDLTSDRIVSLRPPKASVHPWSAYASFREEEPDPSGVLVPSAVILLANQECPFRCVMCDLWTHTLDSPVPAGAIPHQIREALAAMPPVRQLKLYNAGSYFDPAAIPPSDDEAVAATVSHADRVIVESHPAFLRGVHGDRCLRFRDAIGGRLEVAVGLETAHAGILARLNKRMTLASFDDAARFLRRHDIDLRVFILLKPPFMSEDEGIEWACRSIDLAVESGATACSIIPTRGGNGAMEALDPAFVPPVLPSLEAAVEYGLGLGRCRVFADTWDVARFSNCACSPARANRLERMNIEQHVLEPLHCDCARR